MFLALQDEISLWSSGCLPASAFLVLGLKACAIMADIGSLEQSGCSRSRKS